MTYIKELFLDGFKSFAKPTLLKFSKGFNCIIGPNGSGKSNVSDAICFVLGRSSNKTMRAAKAADFIYDGGKKGKPKREAKVSIVFDNSDRVFPVRTKELRITRIVNKKGNSSYYINDEKVTRQKILEILSLANIDPNGYNIVMQGDITRITQMSPLDLREVLEEVAGISIYEDKKNKALKELEKVEQKIKDAEIILKERETYLKELKTDKEAAEKYKQKQLELKQAKKTLIELNIKSKQRRLNSINDEINKLTNKKEKKIQQLNETENKIVDIKTQIQEIKKEIEQKGEKDNLEIQKQIEDLKIKINDEKHKIDNIMRDLETIKSRKQELTRNINELTETIKTQTDEKNKYLQLIKSYENQKQEIQKKLDKIKDKYSVNIDEIEEKIQEIDSKIESIDNELNSYREKQQVLVKEQNKVELKIESYNDQLEKIKIIKKEQKEELKHLENLRKDFKKITVELNAKLNLDSKYAAIIQDNKRKLEKLNEELTKTRMKHNILSEKNYNNNAINEIINSNIKGVIGTVSSLASVQSKYSNALNTAAGNRLNFIVVENDAVAAQCIKYLKNKKVGSASFIPLNKIRPNSINKSLRDKLKGVNGFYGFALDLLNYDSQYKKVFEYVFGNTIVVDNIDVARRIGIGTIRMATLDGDLVEGSGVMHGGFKKHRISSGFKDIDLEKLINEIESKINKISNALESDILKRQELEKDISVLREQKALLEADIIKIENSLNLETSDFVDKDELNNLKEELKIINEKIKENNNIMRAKLIEIGKLKTQKQKLRDEISKVKDPKVIAELNTYENRIKELNNKIEDINKKIMEIELRINQIYVRDKENAETIIKQITKQESELKESLKKLQITLKEQNKELKEKEIKQRKFYSKFKSLFEKNDKLNDSLQKLESSKESLIIEINNIENSINNFNIKLAEIKSQITGLNEELKSYDVESLMNKTEDQLKRIIKNNEEMINSMGNVNLRSLEIYERVNQEYNELIDKKIKLIKEKEDVIKLIADIDEKRKELFLQAFEKINNDFKSIFKQLTNKGEAMLILENPKDPFDGGVKFKIKMKDKLKDIYGFSGGEKSLTALCLLFAIQEYNPAKFYFFDEVDAPLDKLNAEKLSNLIKKYSVKAQYIVVSHNDAVINQADVLFGVSINEDRNMSKIISLKI